MNYWKKKYYTLKKSYELNENIVNMQGIALKKLSLRDNEEVISFRVHSTIRKDEIKKGIDINKYNYNAEIKAKSKSLFYSNKYILKYNIISRLIAYSYKQIIKFLMWHLTNRNKWIIGLKVLGSVGTTSQIFGLMVQKGFTYAGLMLIVDLIIGLI